MGFTQREKREHYNDVSKRKKPVKTPSKFSEQRQVDYATGQAHARNESAAIHKHNQSTPEQREEYKTQAAAKRAATLTGKCKVCGKPCAEKYAVCYGCYKLGITGSAPSNPKSAAPANSGKCKVCGQPCKQWNDYCYACFKAGKTIPAPAAPENPKAGKPAAPKAEKPKAETPKPRKPAAASGKAVQAEMQLPNG